MMECEKVYNKPKLKKGIYLTKQGGLKVFEFCHDINDQRPCKNYYVPPDDADRKPCRDRREPFAGQSHNYVRRGREQLVGERVEKAAKRRFLVEPARDITVREIGHARDEEH